MPCMDLMRYLVKTGVVRASEWKPSIDMWHTEDTLSDGSGLTSMVMLYLRDYSSS